MYLVSKEYSELMRRPIRETQAHATVYFGIIDRTAKKDTTLTYSKGTIYSSGSNLLTDTTIDTSYATFEGNGFRVDGSQALLPDNTSSWKVQSFVSDELSDDTGTFINAPYIEITFSQYHSMIGLSLSYDENHAKPEQVTIRAYHDDEIYVERTISDTVTNIQQLELLLENVNRIIISFDKTVVPHARARINKLEFGIGYTYADTDLIQVVERHQGSPVSLTLPVSSFEFALYNEDNRFGVDTDTQIQRFLAEGQLVNVDYAVDLEDGSVQEIPGGVWELKSWTVDGITAQFQLEDTIQQLTRSTFYKGIYDRQEHTLYSLAEAVLQDGGLEPKEYYIDPFLKKITTTAPLPILTHAEALQIIANAGMSKLFMDREGILSLETTVEVPPTVSSPTEQTVYSNINSTFSDGNQEYATFENWFFRVDGSQLLLPDENDPWLAAGWVGQNVSADGLYPENEFLINYDAPTNVFSLTIDWGGSIPKSVEFTSLDSGVWGNKVTIYPTAHIETYSTTFRHISSIKIKLKESRMDYVRPRILYVNPSKLSDFTLKRNQILGNPVGTMEAKLRNVIVDWVSRSVSAEETEIAKQEIETNSGWTEFQHQTAMDINVSAFREVEGEGGIKEEVPANDVTIDIQNYAYISYISVTSATTEKVIISIKGKLVSEKTYTLQSVANPNGEDQTLSNPLFDKAEIARNIADWVRDYYSSRITYKDAIRGFPELEYGDTIYLDDDVPATITDIELSYNGAFNENLVLRR